MKPKPEIARYKRLNPARQKTLFEWLTGDTEKKVKPLTLAAASVRVKKQWGVKISRSRLSDFYAWYSDSLNLQEAKQFRENMAEFLAKHPEIDLDSDRVEKLAQIVFMKEAMRTKNGRLFLGLRRAKQKDLDQAMDRDRFEVESIERFLKWYAMTKMRDLADSELPHSAKIAAMRKVAFQDVDALEESGNVKLPPAA